MIKKEIRWGIIGCGNVTEVKSGPAFNKVPDSKLVAVMRRNEALAEDYARRHGVPKWYGNANALIEDDEVDAIYIATPPSSHEAYALQCLRAGKPVYLEKPITIDASSARRIAQEVIATNGKLAVAHYRRRQPIFLAIKGLLDNEEIGDIRLVNLQLFQPDKSSMIAQTSENWRVNPAISGGGLFHDLAPHQLDLMLYFFGKPFRVNGVSLNQAGLYEADDVTAGQIVFADKVVFNGIWNFNVPEEERMDLCEIVGSKGKISFSVFDHQQFELIRGGHTEIFRFDKLEHVQQPMIKSVVAYFLGREPNPCPIEEGVEVMAMIDGMTKHE